MIGVQLYGLNEEIAKDQRLVLQTLHDMGIGAIEPFISFRELDFACLKPAYTAWKEFGFDIPSAHVDIALLKDEKSIGKTLRSLYQQTGISTFIFSGMAETEREGQHCGEILGAAAREAGKDGVSILYHNHTMEFAPVSGTQKNILDIILEGAKDLVGLQLDIGWAGIAQDEIAIAKKYANRIVEIHCKDFYPGARQYTWNNMPRELFAPIGEGLIQTKAVLDMVPSFPQFNGAVLIDQDQSTGQLLDDIRVGYQNLASIVKGQSIL